MGPNSNAPPTTLVVVMSVRDLGQCVVTQEKRQDFHVRQGTSVVAIPARLLAVVVAEVKA